MSCTFPTSPVTGATYDCVGFHYIFDGSGWVNKAIYGVVGSTYVNLGNYNGTGPSVIEYTGVSTFNGATGAVIGASLGANTFTGLNEFNAGISASGITTGGMVIQGNLIVSGYIISDGLMTSKAGFRGFTGDGDDETLDEVSIDGGEY